MNTGTQQQQQPLASAGASPTGQGADEMPRRSGSDQRTTRPPYYVRQKAEKRVLRAQIHELEQRLAHWTAHAHRHSNSTPWQVVAQQQRGEKHRAQLENDRLRQRLDELAHTYRALQQVR